MSIRVTPTRFRICGLPEDDVNATIWSLDVEYRGRDTWAVMHLGYCYDAKGERDYEPLPSSRTEEWLALHRFDLETAMRLAIRFYPDLVVNGMKVYHGELVHAATMQKM